MADRGRGEKAHQRQGFRQGEVLEVVVSVVLEVFGDGRDVDRVR
jgi:hypothetical protein